MAKFSLPKLNSIGNTLKIIIGVPLLTLAIIIAIPLIIVSAIALLLISIPITIIVSIASRFRKVDPKQIEPAQKAIDAIISKDLISLMNILESDNLVKEEQIVKDCSKDISRLKNIKEELTSTKNLYEFNELISDIQSIEARLGAKLLKMYEPLALVNPEQQLGAYQAYLDILKGIMNKYKTHDTHRMLLPALTAMNVTNKIKTLENPENVILETTPNELNVFNALTMHTSAKSNPESNSVSLDTPVTPTTRKTTPRN